MLFDDSVPSRVVPLADQERHATADRFYQLLVNEKLGEFMNNVRAPIAGGYGRQNWKDEVGLMA